MKNYKFYIAKIAVRLIFFQTFVQHIAGADALITIKIVNKPT